MTTFYLIRHGATDAIGRSFTGRLSGVALNAEGRKQAQALAHRLLGEPIRAIYSSPSDRARETASLVGEQLGLAVIERAAFHEIDVGDWSGASFEDLNRREDFQNFNSSRSLCRPPSGEMMLEVQSRVVAELLQMTRTSPDASVAVISHSDVIKAALAYFLGMPLDLASRLQIDLGSISLVRLDARCVQVLAVNR